MPAALRLLSPNPRPLPESPRREIGAQTVFPTPFTQTRIPFTEVDHPSKRHVHINKIIHDSGLQPAIFCRSTITPGIPGVPFSEFMHELPEVILTNMTGDDALYQRLAMSPSRASPTLTFLVRLSSYNVTTNKTYLPTF